MLLGDKPLIFKVDPLSTGSDALIVGTEEMPPGNKIPTHKHLHEDEVIFVHKGAVRVTLAGREYDAGTGATFSFRMETGSAWRTFPASLP
jgi:quercetin dioxygenase-like cupin family protein